VTPPGVAVTQNSLLAALNARAAWVTARKSGSHALLVMHTTDSGHTWHSYPLALPNDAAGIARLTFADA
jgi:hypothetical protein